MIQRENGEITATRTLSKGRDEVNSGRLSSENRTEIELRKRVKELEGALAEISLENHILKKTEEITRELKRRESLSGAISHVSSGSKGAAKRSG